MPWIQTWVIKNVIGWCITSYSENDFSFWYMWMFPKQVTSATDIFQGRMTTLFGLSKHSPMAYLDLEKILHTVWKIFEEHLSILTKILTYHQKCGSRLMQKQVNFVKLNYKTNLYWHKPYCRWIKTGLMIPLPKNIW